MPVKGVRVKGVRGGVAREARARSYELVRRGACGRRAWIDRRERETERREGG